jgi:hypothetical protein
VKRALADGGAVTDVGGAGGDRRGVDDQAVAVTRWPAASLTASTAPTGRCSAVPWVRRPLCTATTFPGVAAVVAQLGRGRGDAPHHDEMVAVVSHVPAPRQRLMGVAADRRGARRPVALAAGGFRDMTRAASGI